MPKTKDPIDKPNRRTVEKLFDELTGYRMSEIPEYQEWDRLREEVRALEAKLSEVPQMRRLKLKRDAAEKRYEKRRDAIGARARKVRLIYRSRGLTPQVIQAVHALVKFATKGS